MIMHFKTQKERLDYLKGGFEEIIPKEVKIEEEKPKKEKKSPNKAEKNKKSVKEDKKDGKVQAE